MGLTSTLKKFLPLILIFCIGLFLFYRTFNLEVFGDNWMVFWNGLVSFGKNWGWNSLTTYINPYGSNHLLLYIIAKFFGYSGQALYITAFIFRLSCSFAVYWFLTKRNFSKLSSFICALIFMVSPIGIEVYDWAFQAVSYLCLIFILLMLDRIIKMNSLKDSVLCLVYFALAVGINPIRLHGILILAWPLLLAGVFLAKGCRKKYYLIAFVSSLVLFYILLEKLAFGDPENARSMINPGIVSIFDSLLKKDFIPFLRFFSNVGSGLIPNTPHILVVAHRPNLEAIILSFSVYLVLTLVLTGFVKARVRFFYTVVTLPMLGILIYLSNKTMLFKFGDVERLSAIVGITLILSLLFLLIYNIFFNRKGVLIIYTLLIFSAGFLILPWAYSPVSVLSFEHRYFVFNALVIPLILAIGVSSKYMFSKFSSFLLAIFVLVGFYRVTDSQISMMVYRHGADYASSLWRQIDSKILDYNSKDTAIFYFESSEPDRVHESVVFGLPFRMGLVYKNFDFYKLPVVVEDRSDFISMVTDGKASRRYIGKVYIFPRNEVFAFRIKDGIVERLHSNYFLPDPNKVKYW